MPGWKRGCLAQSRSSVHPEQRDKTVWEVFEAERQSLIAYRGPLRAHLDRSVDQSRLCRMAERLRRPETT
jgi:hypothetical protein